jgi:hypothetical protein
MVKIKLLFTICCLFLLFGCSQQDSRDETHHLLIDCLFNAEPQDYPSAYGSAIIFCKINGKDELGYISIDRLHPLFNHNGLYREMGYENFIKNILFRKITLGRGEVEGSFIPDEKIMLKYDNCSFQEFLDTYTRYVEKDRYAINNKLSPEEEMTMIYCLYQHNYYTGFDYIGLYL